MVLRDLGSGGVRAPIVACALLVLIVVQVSVSRAFAEQPPPGGMLLDHICDKELVCRGDVSAGVCIGAGAMCSNASCTSQEGCSYEYDWECVPGEGRCEHTGRVETLIPACGPKCVNVAWNACQCQCVVNGAGTIGPSVYWQCFSRDPTTS